MDLLDNVATELNFEFHLYVVRDQLFGSKQQRNVKDFLRSNKKQSTVAHHQQQYSPYNSGAGPTTNLDRASQATSQKSTHQSGYNSTEDLDANCKYKRTYIDTYTKYMEKLVKIVFFSFSQCLCCFFA